MRAAWSLQQRIVLAFGGLTLFVCTLFVLLAMAMMYSLEDRFFERMLAEEGEHQRQAAQAGQAAPAPLRRFISLHADASSFPPDLAAAHAAHPARRELAGEQGRHYHLLRLEKPRPLWLVAEVSEQLEVRPQRAAILWNLGLMCGVLLLLSLSLGWWLARDAVRPLARLDQALREAPPGTEPPIALQNFPRNELGRLAATLKAAWQRNKAFSEREQQFGRDASHELRTPLAVIANSAELLQARGDLPAHAEAPLARIREACRSMTQTVQSLLALAREPLQLPPPQRYRLLALVLQALELQRSAALARAEPAPPFEPGIDPELDLIGQPEVLAVILNNLLANAAQHAPGALVRLRWADGELWVENEGPGLAGGCSGERQAGTGLGLGLSIVQRLCERHGLGYRMMGRADGGIAVALRL